MGYNTTYTLEIQGIKNEEDFQRLKRYLESMDLLGYAFAYEDDFIPFSNKQTISAFDECHWYDHEEDMIKVSYAFPYYVFCLNGEGENPGDFWRQYFQKGVCETCNGEIVYPKPQKITWETS